MELIREKSSFYKYWHKKLQFLDVHYHANPDSFKRRYHPIEAGSIYQKNSGACVLKNHLGSTTAFAQVAQSMQLPVFGSIVLNDIAGGLSAKPIQQSLTQYSFAHSGRLMVHLPTIVPTTHKSSMKRVKANKYVDLFANKSLGLLDAQKKLKSDIKHLIEFIQQNSLVLSTGHASKREIYILLEYIDELGYNFPIMLNQPANPITNMNADELLSLEKKIGFLLNKRH
tara:strand:- start:123 stop:803 length:681 start_codon:yes stop_codon:yes gene_type:complete